MSDHPFHSQRGKNRSRPSGGGGGGTGNGGGGSGQPRSRKNRSGKRTPFRSPSAPRGFESNGNQMTSPSQVADMMRQGEEAKSGQFAEQLAGGNKPIKKERLHKVLAQSGHGSRRDMEILIASGRVTINGNVATAGAHVSPGDKVLIDHRLVPIKFAPELPRVLLYHKPEGEIVSTSDPGNRITVFDNLPKVENAKWVAIGRLDFNTSGLLIFTTNGDLANKMMHPRFEVEREYAVRILGELTEEQTQRLLDGIQIDGAADEDDEDGDSSRPARFSFIEKRSGPDQEKSTANNWYHVIIKEGRNREIRRMFEALGLTVSRLMRVRFGKIELPPRLQRGRMQELDPAQVKDVLTWAGVSTEGMDFAAAKPAGKQRGQRNQRGQQNQQRGQGQEEGQAAASGERREEKRGKGQGKARKQRGAPGQGQARGQNTGQGQGKGQGKRQGQGQGSGQGQPQGKQGGRRKKAGTGGGAGGNRGRGRTTYRDGMSGDAMLSREPKRPEAKQPTITVRKSRLRVPVMPENEEV
jgi:23S rRNA pseudouridine2605 synthase